jgi:DNA-directed RNA polymerase subunit RPC12/RpoP
MMQSEDVRCPECGSDDCSEGFGALAGKYICNGCGHEFVVPGASVAP